MPYPDGSTPEVGDRVKHQAGKTGTVLHVQLNFPSTPGHDAVGVKFDDGSSVGVSLADEYTLLSKAK